MRVVSDSEGSIKVTVGTTNVRTHTKQLKKFWTSSSAAGLHFTVSAPRRFPRQSLVLRFAKKTLIGIMDGVGLSTSVFHAVKYIYPTGFGKEPTNKSTRNWPSLYFVLTLGERASRALFNRAQSSFHVYHIFAKRLVDEPPATVEW